MLGRNTILLGVIIGLLVPIVGYAIWMMAFEQLEKMQMASGVGMNTNFRERTTALLAVCMNLLPFLYFSKNNHYNTMRGLVFPTVIFALVWFGYFGSKMIG